MELVRHLAPLAGLVAFLVALLVLRHALAGYHYHQLRDDLRSIPILAVVLACLLTLADYIVLTLYDLLALRSVHGDLGYPKVAATAFMAYAFSHNLGYAVLSGGAMRWRFYSSWGLPEAQIAAITLIGGLAYWLGFLAVGGSVLLLWPPPRAARSGGRAHRRRAAAADRAAGAGAGAALAQAAARAPLEGAGAIHNAHVGPDGDRLPGLAAGGRRGLGAAACDARDLLRPLPGPGFLLALAAGNVSQVPGGLGVLEASLLMMLGGKASTPALAGALLAYRMIYYLAPFILAMALLLVVECSRQREWFGRVANAIRRMLRPLLPHAAGGLAFVAGAVLLLSGTTPIAASRVHLVQRWLPLGLLETAHLCASMCGMALLLIGRGLQLRLRDAYIGSLVLLGSAAVLSLLKGLDWEEALLLLAFFAVIAPFASLLPAKGQPALSAADAALGPRHRLGAAAGHLDDLVLLPARTLGRRERVARRLRRLCPARAASGHRRLGGAAGLHPVALAGAGRAAGAFGGGLSALRWRQTAASSKQGARRFDSLPGGR